MKKLRFLIFIFILCFFTVPGICLAGWNDDDTIRDVDDSKTTASGTWNQSTFLPCAIGGAYKYTFGSSGQTITFETERTTDTSGYYTVYARWTAHANRNNEARYRIYDGNTLKATKIVDQREDGCNWRYLATVYLTSGRKAKVVLDPNTASASEATIADAVRFVRQTWDSGDVRTLYDYNIADEPGIDYLNDGHFTESYFSTSSSSLTNVRSVSLTAPTSGYVVVTATGHIDFNASDKFLALCLADSPGGSSCDNRKHFLGAYSASATSADQQDFAMTYVYSVSSGTKTYYLKGYKESGSDFDLYVDSFTAMFFPTKY